MGIEQLLQQLAEGKITHAQFLAELKKLLDAGQITQEQHDEAATKADGQGGGGAGGGAAGGGGLSAEEIKRMIQSETDRVRTEYAKQLKAANDELEKLKREKLTDEERAKLDAEKLKRELEEKEAALLAREVALHTTDELRRLELPLSFRDILAGPTIEDTNKRIDAFKAEWQAALKKAVDETFKNNGGDPGKGKGGNDAIKNPWMPGQINLTMQAKLLKEQPELAKQFMAAAGK